MIPLRTAARTFAFTTTLFACNPSPRARPSPSAPTQTPFTTSRSTALSSHTAHESVDGDVQSAWQPLSPGIQWRGKTFSPVRETTASGWFTPRTLRWVTLRLDLSRVSLTLSRVPGDDLARDARSLGATVAFNAGFFEPDHSPSGLTVTDGVTLSPYRPQGGSGVLTVRNHLAGIFASSTLDARSFTASRNTFALQCGPRIIERDGSVGIHRDDRQRAARTAVCVRDHGRTLDVVIVWSPSEPVRGPGLLHLAQWLSGAENPFGDGGCESALNLDGGPSTALFIDGRWMHSPVGPTPLLVVVKPRRP